MRSGRGADTQAERERGYKPGLERNGAKRWKQVKRNNGREVKHTPSVSIMALIPSQVLRVAILLSYFSILCHYKALDMPAHQTYGGSWKFLTFIDLVGLHILFYFDRKMQPVSSLNGLQSRRLWLVIDYSAFPPSLPSLFRCLNSSLTGREVVIINTPVIYTTLCLVSTLWNMLPWRMPSSRTRERAARSLLI